MSGPCGSSSRGNLIKIFTTEASRPRILFLFVLLCLGAAIPFFREGCCAILFCWTQIKELFTISTFFGEYMRCPFCHFADTKVIDSRDAVEQNVIRRRRECQSCKKRFTTFETVELLTQIRKRDGTFEDFCDEKLIKGLSAACRHTTMSHDDVVALASQIKGEFIQDQRQVIPSKEIGEKVMDSLKQRDPVAYIRFACVYRRFKDIGELIEAIETIKPQDPALFPVE